MDRPNPVCSCWQNETKPTVESIFIYIVMYIIVYYKRTYFGTYSQSVSMDIDQEQIMSSVAH